MTSEGLRKRKEKSESLGGGAQVGEIQGGGGGG